VNSKVCGYQVTGADDRIEQLNGWRLSALGHKRRLDGSEIDHQSRAGEIWGLLMPIALRFIVAFMFGAAAVTLITAAFPF